MCPVRLRAFLLCSCVRRHAYRLALRRLHLEVWRQTDTKAPPPIPPTATCLTAQPGVPETAVCKAPPRIGITPGSMGWIPALSLQPAKMRGPVWPLSDFNRSIQEIRRSDCTASVPETAVCKAPPACMVPLGPRHDGLCWETPPGAHVAQRPPDGPRWEAVAPMNMGQLIRQDEEIRRDWPAWPQGATSAHIEGVGQVFRGVHGDTPSESSGDDHLPGLPDDGQPVNQSATVTAAQSPAAQCLNSPPTCDTLAEVADSVWPSAMDVTTACGQAQWT